MAKELYVGHISEQATEEDLRKLFEVMGVVTSVHLIVDQETGEFKRCGYVRMLSEVDLKEVVETLDGTWLIDRCIVVSIAKPQKERPAKTPFVKRKTVSATKSGATPGTFDKKRQSDEKGARPSRLRPDAATAEKTGRSSAARDASKKGRTAGGESAGISRPPASKTRAGQPPEGKRTRTGPRPPAKGRR